LHQISQNVYNSIKRAIEKEERDFFERALVIEFSRINFDKHSGNPTVTLKAWYDKNKSELLHIDFADPVPEKYLHRALWEIQHTILSKLNYAIDYDVVCETIGRDKLIEQFLERTN
jgi:hypothetical protein